MEKPTTKTKSKNSMIMKFLPKAAQIAAVAFKIRPFSPGRVRKPDAQNLRTHLKTVFSGPVVPMIPIEARKKTKSFETQEPTSPKVSCIGQIKHNNKTKHVSAPTKIKTLSYSKSEKFIRPKLVNQKPSELKRIFSGRRKSDESIDHNGAKLPLPDRAPTLSHMMRFASSRDTFVNFDWTSSDKEKDFYSDEEEEEEEEDGFVIPFPAPVFVAGDGGLEKRKEINLWKRRTMAQPTRLQLNIIRAN